MKRADYSLATPEEREQVVSILERNARELIAKKRATDPAKLERRVQRFVQRIRNGEIITGRDFDVLVKLFRKEPI